MKMPYVEQFQQNRRKESKASQEAGDGKKKDSKREELDYLLFQDEKVNGKEEIKIKSPKEIVAIISPNSQQ